MLPFFFRLFVRFFLIIFSTLGTFCLGISYGITPQQLTEGLSSVEGGCFSLSCPMESGFNLTLCLRNAHFGRSLGLRVAPELRVTFRPRMQMVALVSWSGRPLVRHFLYLMGISLCIGTGFVFGSALWSVSLSLSLSLFCSASSSLSSSRGLLAGTGALHLLSRRLTIPSPSLPLTP